MSVLHSPAARRASFETKSDILRRLGGALRRRDDAAENAYSPVACISLLVIVGLVIEFGPAIHGFLQHW
jgi:hypothetical protein